MKFIALLLLFLAHIPVHAQAEPPSVSLLTFAPGEVYWQRFGHNALLLRDAAGARVYNYGVFDFHQRGFFLNFARGHMQYRLVVEPLPYTLRQYDRENRWAYEQELNLSREQRLAMRDFLEWNARPENAEYRYDYFVSNCSTRVRDAIDRALGGALRRQFESRPTEVDYRFEATRMMSPIASLAIGMDYLMGPAGDLPIDVWQQAFLPMTLMQALRDTRIAEAEGAAPLVTREFWLLPDRGVRVPQGPPSLVGLFLALGLLLGGLLFLLSRSRIGVFSLLSSALMLVTGLGGLVLIAAWTLTEHWAIWRNFNLLLTSPLSLLLLPACFGARRMAFRPSRFARAIAWIVVTAALLGLLLSPWSAQDHLHWILLWLPIHLGLALGLSRKAGRTVRPESLAS